MSLKNLNISYSQKGNVCVTASYGLIIEYFSKGEHSLQAFFEKFKKHYFLLSNKIEGVEIETENIDQLESERLISTLFDKNFETGNIRGFDFIKSIHENDVFSTKNICRIVSSNALVEEIDHNEKERLHEDLKSGGLAMVLYKTGETLSHSIIVGYDTEKLQYFKRDPYNPTIEYTDFLAENEITEYLLFRE